MAELVTYVLCTQQH